MSQKSVWDDVCLPACLSFYLSVHLLFCLSLLHSVYMFFSSSVVHAIHQSRCATLTSFPKSHSSLQILLEPLLAICSRTLPHPTDFLTIPARANIVINHYPRFWCLFKFPSPFLQLPFFLSIFSFFSCKILTRHSAHGSVA